MHMNTKTCPAKDAALGRTVFNKPFVPVVPNVPVPDDYRPFGLILAIEITQYLLAIGR